MRWPFVQLAALLSILESLVAINYEPSKFYIHIIAHSHVDIGRLKTYEQYLYGLNSTLHVFAGVQYILTSEIDSLIRNQDRKFIFAEMSFFEV